MNEDGDAHTHFGSSGDPRMRGFKTRTSVESLVDWIEERIESLAREEISLDRACGRVLAREIVAEKPVPPFDRSAMDGDALRAEETFGASVYTPATFRLVVRSRPVLSCAIAVGES